MLSVKINGVVVRQQASLPKTRSYHSQTEKVIKIFKRFSVSLPIDDDSCVLFGRFERVSQWNLIFQTSFQTNSSSVILYEGDVRETERKYLQIFISSLRMKGKVHF
jgi:hypothetical protein